ncbi:MAG TPA: hypothetical protein VMG59_12155 [Phycisphaerae bacterium]|nr:hypothetical protein [Phycisphaerae bacterium]
MPSTKKNIVGAAGQTDGIRLNGVVERISGRSLVYISTPEGKTLVFTPEAIENYRGQSFTKLHLRANTPVSYSIDSKSGKVTGVKIKRTTGQRRNIRKVYLRPQQDKAPALDDAKQKYGSDTKFLNYSGAISELIIDLPTLKSHINNDVVLFCNDSPIKSQLHMSKDMVENIKPLLQKEAPFIKDVLIVDKHPKYAIDFNNLHSETSKEIGGTIPKNYIGNKISGINMPKITLNTTRRSLVNAMQEEFIKHFNNKANVLSDESKELKELEEIIAQCLKKCIPCNELVKIALPDSTALVLPTQHELLPNNDSKGTISDLRALPDTTRKFGKLIDTKKLCAGDLLLVRDVKVNDFVSKWISQVQNKGGYKDQDAQWTHAAMYIGDGYNVVEATFDSLVRGGNVRITNLDKYCNGTSVLRFRRPKYIKEERQGWRLCIRALSRLNIPYNFAETVKMWFNTVLGGVGFYSEKVKYHTSRALICSTLYADSYNEAFNKNLGEKCGACLPAFLSLSEEFDDVEVSWLKII